MTSRRPFRASRDFTRPAPRPAPGPCAPNRLRPLLCGGGDGEPRSPGGAGGDGSAIGRGGLRDGPARGARRGRACGPGRARAMDANVPKRKEPGKSLRIKVISMGNAEVGKVSTGSGAGPRRTERRADWRGGRPLNSLGLSLLPAPRQAGVPSRGRGGRTALLPSGLGAAPPPPTSLVPRRCLCGPHPLRGCTPKSQAAWTLTSLRLRRAHLCAPGPPPPPPRTWGRRGKV